MSGTRRLEDARDPLPQKKAPHARVSPSAAQAKAIAEAKGTRCGKGARLDYLVELMGHIPNRWSAKAFDAYYKLFDISPETAKRDAAEASRIIERQLDDPQLKRKLGMILDDTLDELATIAKSTQSPFAKVQALRERRETVQTWADLRGVGAPKVVEVTGVSMDDIAKAREQARQAAEANES